MAVRKPLVIANGLPQVLQPTDTLFGATANIEFTATNNNANPIVSGMAVCIDGDGTVDLAQADAIGTSDVVALVVDASIANAAEGQMRHSGTLSVADWSGILEGASATLTPGSRYYLSPTTAGKLTATAPTTTGQSVVLIGKAVSTDTLLIEIDQPILL